MFSLLENMSKPAAGELVYLGLDGGGRDGALRLACSLLGILHNWNDPKRPCLGENTIERIYPGICGNGNSKLFESYIILFYDSDDSLPPAIWATKTAGQLG